MASESASDRPVNGESPEPEVAITFRFNARTGDLASVSGNVSVQQLLLVAFEANQIAVSIRAGMQSRSLVGASDIADIRKHLARERR
jgi:hypothetical protein